MSPKLLILSLIATVLPWALVEAKHHHEHGPEQVHISLGTDETEMIVTWNSLKHDEHEPEVHYGLNADNLTEVVVAEKTHFIQGPSSFYVYRALLTGLRPASEYFYQMTSSADVSSKIYHFRTLNASTAYLPQFAVYGDLGFKDDISLPYLSKDVKQNMYDAIFHLGGFAYDLHDHSGKLGDKFMNAIEPVASQVPYMTCPGSHEKHANFSHYNARFSMLGDREHPRSHAPLSKRLNNHFYSVDIGPAHLVLFSTEFYYATEYGWEQIERQYRWLEEDLAQAAKNRSARPWIIVMGHRPLYCLKKTHDDDCDVVAQQRPAIRQGIHMYGKVESPLEYGLEKLFFKYGVDVQLYAHEQFYVRTLPLYDFHVMSGEKSTNAYEEPRGPVHITTGSAGTEKEHPDFNPHLKNWVAEHFQDYGYTRLRFDSVDHLVLEQVSDDQHGKVLDKIDIIKAHK